MNIQHQNPNTQDFLLQVAVGLLFTAVAMVVFAEMSWRLVVGWTELWRDINNKRKNITKQNQAKRLVVAKRLAVPQSSKEEYLPEELYCEDCGTLLAYGCGDFNATRIVCVSCRRSKDEAQPSCVKE